MNASKNCRMLNKPDCNKRTEYEPLYASQIILGKKYKLYPARGRL